MLVSLVVVAVIAAAFHGFQGDGIVVVNALTTRRTTTSAPPPLLPWIVLVDDEASIRSALGQFFREQQYHVTTCPDGATTLTTLQSGQPQQQHQPPPRLPDCLISDIRMPGMDGLELVRRIRTEERLSIIPVVLLTAKGQIQDRIAGYEAGADAYLSKPFSPEELLAIVENIVERSHTVRRDQARQQEPYDDNSVEALTRDLREIKQLLLTTGGSGGVGQGWVERTNVFLSTDERLIVDLVSRGFMTKEIAAATHLSARRIEQILTELFRKTDVKNRTELVRWAVSTGNVD